MPIAKSDTSVRTPLTVREKLCYGLGDVSNGLAVSSVTVWLLIYLTDVAGLGAFLAGVAVTIGRLWDAVTDPIMGWLSDHTKSRWGKRRPYLLFGAIPYALSYAALWVVPGFESERFVFLYVLFALLVFNTCLTVVFVPYTSLTAAITNDYNERTSITGYRMVSSQTAFLVGAAVPSAIIAWAGTARDGYALMAVLFSVIMVASCWVTFFGTTERDIKEPHLDPSTSSPFGYASSILDELWGNRPFLISVLILLVSNCAGTLAAVNLPYYIQYALDLEQYRTSMIASIFLTAIFSVPLWVTAAKRYGKTRSYQLAMYLYAVVLCCLPLVQQGQAYFAFTLAILIGVGHAAALTIPWAIVPDVVEFDELKVGRRREGLFYGGTTFTYKAATGLAFLISAAALEIIDYIPNQPQTDEVIFGIKMLIGPAPAALVLLGAYLSTKYPLTQEKHQRILDELAEKKSG